jgi:hypothetical protein
VFVDLRLHSFKHLPELIAVNFLELGPHTSPHPRELFSEGSGQNDIFNVLGSGQRLARQGIIYPVIQSLERIREEVNLTTVAKVSGQRVIGGNNSVIGNALNNLEP